MRFNLKVHVEARAGSVACSASLQPGARRCESPLPGPLCSADPVVGVVVQKRREERGAQQLSEQTETR